MNTVIKMLSILTPSERRSGLILIYMSLIIALFEVVGVASIMPFLAVLTNPSLIETNAILKYVFKTTNSLGVRNAQDFLFFLGVVVFILLLVALIMRSLNIYAQTNFVLMREHSISKRLTSIYLSQDYSWFLNKNSAELGKTILSEVGHVIGNGLLPLTIVISQGTLTIAMMLLLIIVDPLIALCSAFLLIFAYGIMIFFTSGRLKYLGYSSVEANKDRYTAVNEAFSTIKTVKATGWEKAFTHRFSLPSKRYAKSYASARIIEQVPRFVIEGIVFGGMLLVILFAMRIGYNMSSILPIIAVYAFAGYRLLPAMQQMYAAISQLRFVGPAVDSVCDSFIGLSHQENLSPNNAIPLTQSIEIKNVSYTYPNSPQKSLTGINLKIKAGEKIAFVGATGSGKTTLVDVILGLLISQEGELIVDKNTINCTNRRMWQKSIGYVSQDIALTDDTILSNIAFGMENEAINEDEVKFVAKIANLHEFIINDLPNGYLSKVGERGVRLSGGQRQRIGIARALYRKPQVLILDEATSALDGITERAVMDGIANSDHSVTIIIIAHRLVTTKECDQIYLLNKGKIINQGTYANLITSDNQFIKMANMS